MKILVTGATGFIGNHLIKELLKNKSFEVIATSRNLNKAKKFDWFTKVQYIEYNINSNIPEDLYKFFDKPDKVLHLAWEGLPNYKDLIHIEKNLINHYQFIKNLIEGGLKDITTTGTCLEYGMKNGCLSENTNTNPSNSYAIAKDTLRNFILELNKKFDFNHQWIRLFYMYGEGQSEKSLISLLDKAIENQDKEFNMSGGEQLRDYLHISEVVKNIISIVNQNIYTNQIINCCSGRPISIRNLVEKYLQEKNYQLQLNLGFHPYPTYEPMSFWGNSSKLLKIKGNNQ